MKSILIVEDEIVSAIMLKTILENNGYHVPDMVASGEDAVRAVRLNEPDMILMDIQLSGDINGIEAAELIGAFSRVSIVYVTGNDNAGVRREAEKTKPAAFIKKPYNGDRLISELKKIFQE